VVTAAVAVAVAVVPETPNLYYSDKLLFCLNATLNLFD
jgi:hypothetical protein